MVVGMAKKYRKLAWEIIGLCFLTFGFLLIFIIYSDTSDWRIYWLGVLILGWMAFVPMYWAIRHLLIPNILIGTKDNMIFIARSRTQVDQIPMQNVKSIFPTKEVRPEHDNLGGIEITTHDGEVYIRDRLLYRHIVIKALVDKIYRDTGNIVEYFSLQNMDGSDV